MLEPIRRLCAPHPGLIGVSIEVGKIDSTDDIVLVCDIAPEQPDFKIPCRVAKAQAYASLKLCIEGVFNALVEKIVGFSLESPVGKKVQLIAAGDGKGVVKFDVRGPFRCVLEWIAIDQRETIFVQGSVTVQSPEPQVAVARSSSLISVLV